MANDKHKNTFKHSNYRTFTKMLVPPENYCLDFVYGQTYTLDLDYLMATLYGLAQIDPLISEDGEEEIPNHKMLALFLEYSKKMSVVYQADKMKKSGSKKSKIHRALDSIVYPYDPGKGKCFHPKFWLCRFRRDRTRNEYKYRILILSRNLSNSDAYFESGIMLEGDKSTNLSMIDKQFSKSIQELCRPFIDPKKKKTIDHLLSDLDSVKFSHFNNENVHHLHLQLKENQPLIDKFKIEDYKEAVIVSPFLRNKLFSRIKKENDKRVGKKPKIKVTTFSIDSELEKISPNTFKDKQFNWYSLEDRVKDEESNDVDDENANIGLHAKIYLFKTLHNETHIFIGSANASMSGLCGNNIEILYEYKMKGLSTQRFLEQFVYKEDDKKKMYSWINPKLTQDLTQDEKDKETAKQKEDNEAQNVLYDLISLNWKMTYSDSELQVTTTNFLDFKNKPLQNIELKSVTIVPFSLDDSHQINFKNIKKVKASFQVDLSEASQFLEIVIKYKGKNCGTRVKKCIAKINTSADFTQKRNAALLTGLIKSEEELRRCVFFLLNGHFPTEGTYTGRSKHKNKKKGSRNKFNTPGLFESLMRKTADDEEVLNQIDELLKLTKKDIEIKDFEELFKNIKDVIDDIKDVA